MENIRYADILNEINNSWRKVVKAKYIYDQICKKSSYDERFIYSQIPELLNSIYNRKVNVDEYTSPKLICKTLNDIYSELLTRTGIRNEIITKPSFVNKHINAEDVALIFYDEDGMTYFTNIAADIQRCKYGMKTQFFGGCDENYDKIKREKLYIIKADELEAIDRSTGFINKTGIYSDVVFDMISKEVKQNNELKKFLSESGIHLVKDYLKDEGMNNVERLSDDEIKRIIQDLTADEIIKIKMRLANLLPNKDETSGPIENKKYSIKLLKDIFNRAEYKKYDCFDMVKENGEQVEVLSILRFNIEPEPIYYLYSKKSGKYELLSIKDILKINRDYKEKNNHNLVSLEIEDR